MNRWTKKELEEIDDLSFAIGILRERIAMLNQYAPLAVKTNKAVQTLESLRGNVFTASNSLSVIQERIFREKEREYFVSDINCHLTEDWYTTDLHGMTAEQVLADEEIVNEIIHLYGKCETYHSENMEYAISEGISTIIKKRKDR